MSSSTPISAAAAKKEQKRLLSFAAFSQEQGTTQSETQVDSKPLDTASSSCSSTSSAPALSSTDLDKLTDLHRQWTGKFPASLPAPTSDAERDRAWLLNDILKMIPPAELPSQLNSTQRTVFTSRFHFSAHEHSK